MKEIQTQENNKKIPLIMKFNSHKKQKDKKNKTKTKQKTTTKEHDKPNPHDVVKYENKLPWTQTKR